jgi:ATP-binding cassette subfamily F protein 3
MLTVHDLSKSFSVHPILQNVTFSINRGDRVGLIGPNGSGKTTLLRILAGEERPDRGHVAIDPAIKTGYLTQGFELDPELTVDQVLSQATGDPELLQAKLEQVALELAAAPDDGALQMAYDHVLQQINRYDPGQVLSIVETLGLIELPEEQPVGLLSGGQKTRLALALILLWQPDLLLLDEPTNHLDLEMLEWLEQWLGNFRGAALIVSHDRAFLDRSVNRILALDEHTHQIREYAGNYSDYLEQYLQEREKQWTAYRDQVYEIRRMEQDINRIKQQAKGTEQATKNDQLRRYAKKVARKAKSREKKLERYRESDERVEKPSRSWQMKLEFGEPQHVGQDIAVLEELAVGYPGYPPLLEALNLRIQGGQRVVLTGPNGSGKSTLLRTIAGHIAPRAGAVRLGAGVKIGYMTQEQRHLEPQLNALQMVQRAAPLNETDARSFLHFFLFSDDEPLRPSAQLSFGERARLSLALLVAQGCNFLLLDEPINHLDIPSRSRFEEALLQFEGTILAVVHDRYFIDAFATDLWRVTGESIMHQIYEL